MNQLSQVPLTAILVGINKYTNHPQLINKTATGADDAKKFHDFLINEMKVDPKDVTLLQDSTATGGSIIKALDSLKEIARTSAILFYFSGYTGLGRQDEDNSRIGMICPSDIGTAKSGTPGIADKTLIQLFDNISMARGNNITVFLDCGSEIFTWGNPSSFVVVAPNRSAQAKTGGVFTDVLINVLRSEVEKESIQMLTVRSLADKIKADMDLAVHCYGRNADRLLFNPQKAKAFYPFISGNKVRDGSIILLAGFAQGVQKDTIYGIYPSNIISNQNTILGYFRVSSVDSATSATLSPLKDDPNLSPPTVFYAVEIRYPCETVNVFFSDKAHRINIPSGKEVEDPNMANITLKIIQDRVGFSFNGVTGDHEEMRDTEAAEFISLPLNDPHTIRTIRSAARFMYHISRLSPDDSPFSVKVELQEITAAKQPIGQNLLNSELFATLNVPKNRTRGPFGLFLHNNNPGGKPLWPFIFIGDVRSFSISPWYIPPATAEAPLKPGGRLTVGCGDEYGLQLRWREDCKSEMTYIKIFLTTEPTNFLSLIQNFQSPSEDRFREAYHPKQYSTTDSEGTGGDGSEISQSPRLVEHPTDWAAMRVTIKQTFGQGRKWPGAVF